MKAIKVEKNQTIYDIAIQELGNVEAVFEIIYDNNLIGIDITKPLIDVRKVVMKEEQLKTDYSLILLIREDSVFKNSKVLKELNGKKIYTQ